MDLAEILTRCRPIVERHHQQTEAALLAAIDAAIASPAQRWNDVAIQTIAMATELPVGTVARILVCAEYLADGAARSRSAASPLETAA